MYYIFKYIQYLKKYKQLFLEQASTSWSICNLLVAVVFFFFCLPKRKSFITNCWNLGNYYCSMLQCLNDALREKRLSVQKIHYIFGAWHHHPSATCKYNMPNYQGIRIGSSFTWDVYSLDYYMFYSREYIFLWLVALTDWKYFTESKLIFVHFFF